MTGLIICTESETYNGIGSINTLAEYLDDRKIGEEVKRFLESYVEEETQLIVPSPYAIYDAKALAEKVSKRYEATQVLLYSNEESALNAQAEFIGYDVCADDYYTSPIGLGYLGEIAEYDIDGDEPFFENISNEVRYEYFQQLNPYGLFDEAAPAEEIAEYCNWLCSEYADMFQGAENFKIIKIYRMK